jgi:hypothetical protein
MRLERVNITLPERWKGYVPRRIFFASAISLFAWVSLISTVYKAIGKREISVRCGNVTTDVPRMLMQRQMSM